MNLFKRRHAPQTSLPTGHSIHEPLPSSLVKLKFKIIICEVSVLLNSICSLNGISISDDSSLLAGAFNDSNVRLWTLSPKKLCPLKSYAQLQQIPSLAAGRDGLLYT